MATNAANIYLQKHTDTRSQIISQSNVSFLTKQYINTVLGKKGSKIPVIKDRLKSPTEGGWWQKGGYGVDNEKGITQNTSTEPAQKVVTDKISLQRHSSDLASKY